MPSFFPELSRAERRQRIEEGLQAVGLRPEETLGRYPHQLSGGQRQRIMVARALLLDPRVIVADEPVSMVDASLRATILETLSRIHRERGISLVYITHDLTTAYQLSHTILVMYQGAVVEVGDVEQVIKAPKTSLYTATGEFHSTAGRKNAAGEKARLMLRLAGRQWKRPQRFRTPPAAAPLPSAAPTSCRAVGNSVRRWCRLMPVALRLAISTRTLRCYRKNRSLACPMDGGERWGECGLAAFVPN